MNDKTVQLHNTASRITAGPLHPGSKRQTGTVLFISLIMLLLLTIIGVTAMNNVTLEERMAGNLRDGDLSFQAAEAGLRDGENLLNAAVIPPAQCTAADAGSPCPASKVWQTGVLTALQNQPHQWWLDNGREYGAVGNDLTHVATDPRIIVEYQAYVRDSYSVGHSNPTGGDFYLVTSEGVGGTTTANTILQTSVIKRFN